MARTRTRATMIAQARALADQDDSDNTDAADAIVWLNQALAELWDLLVKADPRRHARRSDLTVASGVREYDFADAGAFSPTVEDLMSVLGVSYVYRAPLQEIPLDPFAFGERGVDESELDQYTPYPGAGVRWDIRYQGQTGEDARLIFSRDPEVNALYYVYVVRSCPELDSDLDVFDGVNGWEDFAVYTTAILMLQREESDASVLMAERARIELRIAALAPKRIAGRSKVIATAWSPDGSHHHHHHRRRFYS